MKAHWQYLKYVLRHKFFVFRWCLRLGVPLHLAIMHDWTKFTPLEWMPYVHSFYNPDGSKRSTKTDSGTIDKNKVAADFALAWLHHQKHNKHHWQAWVLINDEDGTAALEMPYVYQKEMIADWCGAGEAITGKPDPIGWYNKNKTKMILHPVTRSELETTMHTYALASRIPY